MNHGGIVDRCMSVAGILLIVAVPATGCQALTWLDSLRPVLTSRDSVPDDSLYARCYKGLYARSSGCDRYGWDGISDVATELFRAGQLVPELNKLLRKHAYADLVKKLRSADTGTQQGTDNCWNGGPMRINELGFLYFNYARVDSLMYTPLERAITAAIEADRKKAALGQWAVLDTMYNFLFPATIEFRKRQVRARLEKKGWLEPVAPDTAAKRVPKNPFMFATGYAPRFAYGDSVVTRIKAAKGTPWSVLTVFRDNPVIEMMRRMTVSTRVAAYDSPDLGRYGERVLLFDGEPVKFGEGRSYILFHDTKRDAECPVVKASLYRILHYDLIMDLGNRQVRFPITMDDYPYQEEPVFHFRVKYPDSPQPEWLKAHMRQSDLEWAGDIDRDGLLDFVLCIHPEDDQAAFEQIDNGEDPPAFIGVLRFDSGKVPREEDYH